MEDSVNPTEATKVVSEKTDVIKPRTDESIDNLRKLLRPIKYSLVDLFISLARVFFFWLPGGDVGKGQALMVAHFVGGCVLYTLYFIFKIQFISS